MLGDKGVQVDGSLDKWIKTENGFAMVHLENAHEHRYTHLVGAIVTFISHNEASEWNEDDFNKELVTQRYNMDHDPNYVKKSGTKEVLITYDSDSEFAQDIKELEQSKLAIFYNPTN